MSPRRRGSAELGRAGSRSLEHRTGNAIFYVVTEGGRTELDYLDWLNKIYGPRCKFHIRTLLPRTQQNGLKPSDVLEHACHLAAQPDIKQIWGLFDHDERPDIDQVCLRAKPGRVHLALSHPSFEMWLLLHLREFTPGHRQDGKSGPIIDKLRSAHPSFADYGKRRKRIDKSHFDALMEGDGIRKAVHRARCLSRHFARETPSQRDPSTEVYRLIEALGIVPPPS
ncbi:MAG: RloB family protein [Actinomycetota bacterium]|nr:RloB family protein [Actinomycetota bacterium]